MRFGDGHVGDERDDEHAVVEATLAERPQRPDDGVERSDDRDRQVRLQPERDVGLEEEAEADADDESDHRDHGLPSPRGPSAAATSALRPTTRL